MHISENYHELVFTFHFQTMKRVKNTETVTNSIVIRHFINEGKWIITNLYGLSSLKTTP